MEKPTFRANGPETGTTQNSGSTEKKKRKEVAAVWQKTTVSGDTYLSIKIILPDGATSWYSAFPNRFKDENPAKPSFIAFERVD